MLYIFLFAALNLSKTDNFFLVHCCNFAKINRLFIPIHLYENPNYFCTLFIGFAIDGVIHGIYESSMQLGFLGLVVILIGGGRRFYDSRFYAKVYQRFGCEIIAKMNTNDASLKTARLGMIEEIIEFLENTLPVLITTTIGIFGVVVIIAGLNFKIFIGSMIATFLIFFIYYLTSNKTTYLNRSYNDAIEKQVTIIATNDKQLLDQHLRNIMK